jgi:antitoxin (DNA-binding transcriptional repressor) of toxin-antitoxin stability system
MVVGDGSSGVGRGTTIARDGVPVARLVRVEPARPGSLFLAAYGTLADSIEERLTLVTADARLSACDGAVVDPLS